METQLQKYRNQLMGLAIIFIMVCHNSINFDNHYLNSVWTAFSQLFQCGVDIFFFLSGYGLYFSYTRKYKSKNCYGEFIKRRFKRVIPTYVLIVGIYSLLVVITGFKSIKSIILNYSLLTFFVFGNLKEWFIAAIIVLYLIFPVLYKIAQSDKYSLLIILLLWVVSLVASFLRLPYCVKVVFEIFIVRIPTFICGIIFGKKDFNRLNNFVHKISVIQYVCIICLSILICVVWKLSTDNFWTLWRMMFCPISISICLLFSKINLFKLKTFDTALNFLGGITLEIYLMHEKLLEVFNWVFAKIITNKNLLSSVITNVIAILSAILLSWCIKEFTSKKIINKRQTV